MAVTVFAIAAISTIVWIGVAWLVVVACVDDRRRVDKEALGSSRTARGYAGAARGGPLEVRSGNQLAVTAPPAPSAPQAEAPAPTIEEPETEIPVVVGHEVAPAPESNRDRGGEHANRA